MATNPFMEKFEIAGNQLVDTLRRVIDEGNARRVVVKNARGRELFSLPLSVGAAGGGLLVFAHPVVAGAVALAGMAGKLRLEVERVGPRTDADDPASNI